MTAAMNLNYDPKEFARELKLRERVAALIVALRTESDLTFEEIEAKAGISKAKMKSWESGAKSPFMRDVARLTAHCGVSAAVKFQVEFSKLLRESYTRIAELQSANPLRRQQPENFDALGAVNAA